MIVVMTFLEHGLRLNRNPYLLYKIEGVLN